MDQSIEDWTKHQEVEVERLERIINSYQQSSGDGEPLSSENHGLSDTDKLKYRLALLKQQVSAEEKLKMTHVKNMATMLKAYFTMALNKAFPSLKGISMSVSPASNSKFGDYQCNDALSIASTIKLKPREVAERIVQEFPQNTGVVDRLEIAGPGYMNVFLCPHFIREELQSLVLNGVQPPPLLMKQRIIVDFSSPNVAKQMHVGHLRSTIIGDSVCRLLEYLGHEVVRLNHVGDWGTQFGMLIAHLRDTFPDYLKKKDFVLPICDLQVFYREAKARFDVDEEFKKRAYSCVVSLQSKVLEYIRAWELICNVSRQEFQKIYERLGVVIHERGESFYQSRMEGLVQDFEAKGLLTEEEGRKIMFGHEDTTNKIPLTVVKSDGGFTYDTSDLACIKQRIDEEKADWIIYITDAGQSTHFELIYLCAEKAGILDRSKVRIDHIGFGVVLGEDKKKFKTRSGDTVRLSDLLDEGIKRAEEKLREKGRDKELTQEELASAATAVAYGCIKYADLSHSLNHEYVFSFDKMLDDKGNTAVYLLYAYTRISSISRKAGVNSEDLKKFLADNLIDISHEKELKLAKKILRFPEIIDKIVDDLFLHSLCELMYDIATTFTEFYDACYCIEKNSLGEIIKIHMSRLALCEATALILAKGFDLLGIKPVSKM